MNGLQNLADISAGAWTALAAWLAVLAGIAALVYAWRQTRRARQHTDELMQPNVAMFMEPAANDWHLVELVVKNFGRTPAYGIRFEFANPPTVGKYENSSGDRHIDIVPLNLPAEIPYLAPSQEWRIVWDSALDRRELGEAIASRFDGAVTYYGRPPNDRAPKRKRSSSGRRRCWTGRRCIPVERLELLTTHDLARQEKQKLELLRNLLTYYHYAASESREEVLRVEINRVRAAADELRDRHRDQYDSAARPSTPCAPRTNDRRRPRTRAARRPINAPPEHNPPAEHNPPDNDWTSTTPTLW